MLCMLDVNGATEGMQQLQQAAEVIVVAPDRGRLLEMIGDFDAVWAHTDLKMDREVLDRARRLKVINTASTGTDHIDKEAAAERRIAPTLCGSVT